MRRSEKMFFPEVRESLSPFRNADETEDIVN
jgi:hypothetical protein